MLSACQFAKIVVTAMIFLSCFLPIKFNFTKINTFLILQKMSFVNDQLEALILPFLKTHKIYFRCARQCCPLFFRKGRRLTCLIAVTSVTFLCDSHHVILIFFSRLLFSRVRQDSFFYLQVFVFIFIIATNYSIKTDSKSYSKSTRLVMGVQDDMRLVERITNQLAQLDKIIGNFLSTSPIPEETLGQKIVQFEMIVNCIPVWCSGLWVQEWKDKLASFLEQLESLNKPPPLRRDELEHVDAPQVNASSGDLSVMSSLSISSSTTDTSKSLETQMKNAFLALPRAKNFTDVDQLKQVLALGANCMKIINETDTENSPLKQENIFRRVMRKIPADLREAFSQRPAWQQSLQELLCFLRTHISQFQSFEIEEVKEAALEDVIQKLDICDKPPEMCKYCKTFGHEALECTFIKRKLCFNCYQFGHIAKMCTLAPILN